MAQSVDPTDREKPGRLRGFKSRPIDKASTRGIHQGQRHVRPHRKAGHMTASDLCSSRKKSSCMTGTIHTEAAFSSAIPLFAVLDSPVPKKKKPRPGLIRPGLHQGATAERIFAARFRQYGTSIYESYHLIG